MNDAQQLAALKAGQYITGSTDLAASLMACGVEPLKGQPCTNTFTKDKPYRAGRPGKVLFHLEKHSKTFTDEKGEPLMAEKLAGSWEDPEANEKLDALIDQVEDDSLRKKIQAALPFAIMSHHRAAMGNRGMIRKWWRNVTPWVLIKKGKKTFLLPRTAKKTAKKWGITK